VLIPKLHGLFGRWAWLAGGLIGTIFFLMGIAPLIRDSTDGCQTDEVTMSESTENDRAGIAQQWLAIAGIVAPILYISVATIMGLLEPGYSHRTMMMSILGGIGGLRGAAFNLGLVLTGALLIAFGFGLHRGINQGKGNRIGLILLVIAGLGLIGSAYFHCALGCVNVFKEPDFRGQMHILFAFLTGLSFSFSPIPFFFSLKEDSRWKSYRAVTLAASVLANIPGITLWITMFTTRLPEWEGIIQRLGLLFPLMWVEVMAIRLLRLSKEESLKSRFI
jgi:hypothetical protein